MTLTEALNKYRDAIEIRTYWQDHGTYADNHLPEAKTLESEARAQVLRSAK